jgi:outer membrane protein TolC
MFSRPIRNLSVSLIFHLLASASTVVIALGQEAPREAPGPTGEMSEIVSRYYHPAEGASSDELVRRALASNADLAAARLDVERARARLRQAGLRANPTVDFEHATGDLTGSTGERETSVGFSLPLELNGQRKRRIDLAKAELEASEAEIADRERRLAAEVRAAYAEGLAAVREMEITEGLNGAYSRSPRV